MKNLKVACLVAVLWGTVLCCAATDSLTVPSSDGSVKSEAGIWWPSQKSKTASPVVVWFHGGMTSSNCAKGLVAGDDFSKLYPRAVVVSVSACRANHWGTPAMVSVVDGALDSIAAREKRLVEEVSLVGVSDGGVGVIMYSLYGGRKVKDRLSMSTYGAIFGDAGPLASQKKLQTGRWRFLQGGNDRLYPSDVTVPWITEFCKGVRVDCELRFDPAGEHDWSYWRSGRLDWIREAVNLE